jgi:pyruvate dehydrogenase E2 component (dihydrolipoamide acetyltransferase)
MPFEILMPALSSTMTEGSLAKWLKQEGDKIRSGEILAEIETDKATLEFEAINDGTLGKILVAAGTVGVAINTPIAIMFAADEDVAGVTDLFEITMPAAAVDVFATEPLAPPQSVITPESVAGPNGHRIFASPLARRLAKEARLELSHIKGTGPQGRIVAANVETAKASRDPVDSATPIAQSQAPYREIPLNNFRKSIARRLTEAKQTVPHFYLTVDCTVDKLLSLRAQINDSLAAQTIDARVSINDFVIKAVAAALRRVPGANVSFTESSIREYTDVDISVAVATPNGLITPIVRKADTKTLLQISAEMKLLSARAREGKLSPKEFQGGSFSISNLGMYGIKQFEAIINPPQGCILAVGATEERAVAVKGQLVVASQMSCTLSVDHRVVDGALGAEFLRTFKSMIDEPMLMLV